MRDLRRGPRLRGATGRLGLTVPRRSPEAGRHAARGEAVTLLEAGRWVSPLLPAGESTTFSLPLDGRKSAVPFFDPSSPYYHAFFAVSVTGAPAAASPAPGPDVLVQAIVESAAEVARAVGGAAAGHDLPEAGERGSREEVNLPYLAERATLAFGSVKARSLLGGECPPDALLEAPSPGEWSTAVEPGHPLEWHYVAARWSRAGQMVCAYGVSARFLDRLGALRDNAGFLEPELLALLAKLRFRPRRR